MSAFAVSTTLPSTRRGTTLRTCSRPVCTAAPPEASTAGVLSSRVINSILSIPGVFPFMSAVMRKKISSYALQVGADWDAHVARLEKQFPKSERDKAVAHVTDPNLQYPPYYIARFHGYECGNLGWKPAFEAEPASIAVAVRALLDEGVDIATINAADAFAESRQVQVQYMLTAYDHFVPMLKQLNEINVVDVGAGVGISTSLLYNNIVTAVPNVRLNMTAVDASPYMLNVAQKTVTEERVRFAHALAEKTGLDDESMHMYCLQHVAHEVGDLKPIIEEAYRVLKKGGLLCVSDTDRRSEVIMGSVRMTLLKASEPHIDVWWATDLESMANEVGFSRCKSCIAPSKRHRIFVIEK